MPIAISGGRRYESAATAPNLGANRDAIVPGAAKPVGGQTCGLIDESKLTEYNAPTVDTFTIPDGTDLTDKLVYGDAKLPTVMNEGITGQNVLFVGGRHVPTTNSSVIDATTTRSGTSTLLTLKDFEIRPRRESLNRDGVRGHRLRLHRPWIRNTTVDGMGLFVLPGQNGGQIDAQVFAGVIEDLAYFYPDYDNGVSGAAEHTDGTHNDCIQIHGGTNWLIEGMFLNGTGHKSAYSAGDGPTPYVWQKGFAKGSALIVTDDSGVAPDATGICRKSWLHGGEAQLFVTAGVTFTFTDNRHSSTGLTNTSPTWNTYFVRYEYPATGSKVIGLNDNGGTTVTNTTNLWENGSKVGQALASGRANGVHFNTA